MESTQSIWSPVHHKYLPKLTITLSSFLLNSKEYYRIYKNKMQSIEKLREKSKQTLKNHIFTLWMFHSGQNLF